MHDAAEHSLRIPPGVRIKRSGLQDYDGAPLRTATCGERSPFPREPVIPAPDGTGHASKLQNQAGRSALASLGIKSAGRQREIGTGFQILILHILRNLSLIHI